MSSELKAALGRRLRSARLRSGLLQRELAGERYTPAYVSAIEKGLAQPTIAAMLYFAERLGVDARDLLEVRDRTWSRLQADLALASGRWTEALAGFDDLLAEVTSGDSRAEIQRGRAEALCRLGRGTEAVRPAADAAAQFGRSGREADELEARYWLAYAHYQVENLDEASGIARVVLDRARGVENASPELVSRVLVALSHIETWRGNFEQALAYLNEARAGLDGMDARRRASFLFSLAVSYRDAGDMEGAIRAATESLVYFTSVKEDAHVASLENNLALAHLRLGQHGRAEEYVRSARKRAELLRDERLLAHVVESSAQIAMAVGDIGGASDLLDEAEQFAVASSNRAALLSTLMSRARLLRAAGALDKALDNFTRAAELAREDAPARQRREIMREYADVALEAGQPDRAIELYREGLADSSGR